MKIKYEGFLKRVYYYGIRLNGSIDTDINSIKESMKFGEYVAIYKLVVTFKGNEVEQEFKLVKEF